MLIPGISEAYGRKLAEEEEVLMNLSAMLMQLYTLESTMLRVQKIEHMNSQEDILVYRDILDVLTHETAMTVYSSGYAAIASFADEEQQKGLIQALYQLVASKPVNPKEARRRIADKLIEENRYCF